MIKNIKIIIIIFFFLTLLFKNANGEIVDQLDKLNKLFKSGAITEKEFKKAKSILLDSNLEKKIEVKKKEVKKKEVKKKEVKKKEVKKKLKENDKKNRLAVKSRSKFEIKGGVFLEDLQNFGTFNKISIAPEGMFKPEDDQFIKMSKYSQEQIILIFVKNKSLMDKNPENLMLGMGYFEFFYMQQLKDHKRDIRRFKEKYPKANFAIREGVKKIHGLNKARKAMRSALGFDLEDDLQTVLKTYYTLSQLFAQGKKEIIKLSLKEKNLSKSHALLAKNIGIIKNLVKDKNEQRLKDKKYKDEYLKIVKKINLEIKKIIEFDNISDYDHYKQLDEFIKIIQSIDKNETNTLLSAYTLVDFLLTEIKNKNIKKKYIIDLKNVNFSKFNQKELEILGSVSNATKEVKRKKAKEIQFDILNLENNGIPINYTLNNFRNSSLALNSINLQVASIEKMNLWAMSDWANAWKTPIPRNIEDKSKGIMIDLSSDDVEAIKAQLAVQYFKDLVDDQAIQGISSEMSDLKDSINFESFNFSYGLDDYAQFLGDVMSLDIKNYSDLTDLANATYNADWSVEEYSAAYQLNVDAINALASGTSAFDVGQVAQNLGASLQDVADTISAASAAGISVDLEAAAAGLGFDSFAAAVAAYNAEHGTSYSVSEAKEEMGQ